MAVSSIPEVDIDSSGVFKYILIKLTTGTKDGDVLTRDVVRGYADCSYHTDIDDRLESQLNQLKKAGSLENYMKRVLGGGRINHDAEAKTIKVYGYSQGFGKADHTVTVEMLNKVYPDYDITCSDEGY